MKTICYYNKFSETNVIVELLSIDISKSKNLIVAVEFVNGSPFKYKYLNSYFLDETPKNLFAIFKENNTMTHYFIPSLLNIEIQKQYFDSEKLKSSDFGFFEI